MIKRGVFESAETIVGVMLLVILILGSVLMLVLALPKGETAQKEAKPIPILDSEFFTDKNDVSGKIESLRVPSGVPVEVDNNNLGRGNVFDKY